MDIVALEWWKYLVVLFACHQIGDFAFQSAWMALDKAKDTKVNWEIMYYHVVTQTAPFMLLVLVPGMHVTLQGLLLHAMLHGTVDYLKGRGKIGRIWIDQLCHYACTLFEHLIGWI